MIAVSDTSPILYLVLTGEIELLSDLFAEVQVPPAVLSELSHPGSPDSVRAWVQTPPAWLRLMERPDVYAVPAARRLHPGEREVLALAMKLQADRVLLDDRAARDAASALGLRVMGTLAVLKVGADRGKVNLADALRRLAQTNFRASPELLRRVLG